MNTKNILVSVVTIVLAVVISVVVVGGNNQPQTLSNEQIIELINSQLGGGTRFQNGISADSISPNAGQVRGTTLNITGDTTLSGGTLNVTTTNTATSTTITGCIQTYATSTATAVKLLLGSVATSSATFGDGTTVGLVGWRYGSCPNL